MIHRRRFAKKPKNLKKKAEIFYLLIEHRKLFQTKTINRSPLGHYHRIDFTVDGIQYKAIRQYYIRRSGIDYISIYEFGVNRQVYQSKLTSLYVNITRLMQWRRGMNSVHDVQ